MIKVLLVDDSALARLHVRRVIEAAPDLEVVGMAANGAEALDLLKRLKPDVITMDLDMPGLDGYAATRSVMETSPIPIVVVSGLSDATAKAVTLRALEAGAVAVLARPPAVTDKDYARACAELHDTIRTCSEVRLVRRYQYKTTRTMVPVPQRGPVAPAVRLTAQSVVAVGASTGGPVALMELLAALGPNFPLPVYVVQHIAAGFTASMAQWLNKALAVEVAVAQNGERLERGRVLLAPHGRHSHIEAPGVVQLRSGPAEHGMTPAVSVTFRSVAANFGANALGVLLTGMGSDGAAELAQLRQAGAVTFAQDAATSLVFGMPGEAVRLGGATHVLPPRAIAEELLRLTEHL